jgi:hypothetical protein
MLTLRKISFPAFGLALMSTLVACDGHGGTAAGEIDRTPRPPIIPALSKPYAEVPVVNGVSVSGVVTVDGPAPAGQAVNVTSDSATCGGGADSVVAVSNGKVQQAIVWLEGVEEGKARTRERRYELVQERCRLSPRVQAVTARGTVNVLSVDPVVHRTRFVWQPTGEPVSIVSHVDAGQVVPDEKVASRAGLIEIRCDEHEWTHGWLAVFDHPYFAVTGSDGRFELPDVPPGNYRLVTWHERSGRTTRPITVRAGEPADVSVALRLR